MPGRLSTLVAAVALLVVAVLLALGSPLASSCPQSGSPSDFLTAAVCHQSASKANAR